MKILFVHFTADQAGGSDRSLFDLVIGTSQRGIDCLVLLRHGDKMAQLYQEAGIEVILRPLLPPPRTLSPVRLCKFLVSLVMGAYAIGSIARKRRVDLIHVNTSYALQGGLGARLAQVPIVWHVREIGRNRLPDRAIRLIVRSASSRIIAISQAVAVHFPTGKMRVVYNGLHESWISAPQVDRHLVRSALGLKDDQFVISAFGRLEEWKGFHILVRAAALVHAQDSEVRFLVAGGAAANKPEYREHLKKLVQELALEGTFIFLGARDDVRDLMDASDIVIAPTVEPEPFGRTPIEAMARGRPVIASAVGGHLESILPSITGQLVPASDPESLAQAILNLAQNPELRSRMGASGREHVRSHFLRDRYVREMEAVFTESLKTHSPRNLPEAGQ